MNQMFLKASTWASILALLAMGNSWAAHLSKNTAEYQSLCRLLKIAEAGAEIKPAEEAKKLTHHDRFEQVNVTLQNIFDKLDNAKKFPLEVGSEGLGEIENVTSAEMASRMKKVIASMQPLLERIKQSLKVGEGKVESELNKAVTEFRKAIVGNQNWEEVKESYKADPKIADSTERATICKAQGGKPGHAGTALPIDLCCICIPGVNADGRYMCGFYVETQDQALWTSRTAAIVPKTWEIIYHHCEEQKVLKDPNPNNIASALAHFGGLLGRQTDRITSVQKNVSYFFGFLPANTGSSPGCNGLLTDSDTNGVCVDYSGAETSKAAATIAEIKWRTALLEAKNYLEKAEKIAEGTRDHVRHATGLIWQVLREASIPALEGSKTNGEAPGAKTEGITGKSANKGSSPMAGTSGPEGGATSATNKVRTFLRRLLLLTMTLPH